MSPYNSFMPSSLAALSPLDGRYANPVDPLRAHFSEQALIHTRVRIELAWLEALAAERAIRELKPFSPKTTALFRKLVSGFSERGWGSRGVFIGHDLSQEQWGAARG